MWDRIKIRRDLDRYTPLLADDDNSINKIFERADQCNHITTKHPTPPPAQPHNPNEQIANHPANNQNVNPRQRVQGPNPSGAQ